MPDVVNFSAMDEKNAAPVRLCIHCVCFVILVGVQKQCLDMIPLLLQRTVCINDYAYLYIWLVFISGRAKQYLHQ